MGTCSGDPCIQLTSSTVADGVHTFTARQIVSGGPSPESVGLSVTIDTAAGVPPLDLQAASDTGVSNSDNVTNATTRTFDIARTRGWCDDRVATRRHLDQHDYGRRRNQAAFRFEFVHLRDGLQLHCAPD